MKHIELEYLTPFVRSILERSMKEDYAQDIVETEGFMERVRDNVEFIADWETTGGYTLDNVLAAIGKIFLEDLQERKYII